MGISALIGSLIGAVESAGAGIASVGAGLAGDLGASAGVASAFGSGLEGAAGGALLGTGEAALTHQPLWEGALGGAVSGGTIGAFGPAIGATTGLGTTAGDVLAGAGGGALGAELTHQNPLIGAGTGAAGGFISGALSGAGTPSAPAPGGITVGGGLTPGISGAPPAGTFGVDVGGVPTALTSPPVSTAIGATPVTGIDTSGISLTQPALPTLTSDFTVAGGTPSAPGGDLSTPSDVTAQLPGGVGTGAAGPGVPDVLSQAPAVDVSAPPPSSTVSLPTGPVGQAAAPFTTPASGDLTPSIGYSDVLAGTPLAGTDAASQPITGTSAAAAAAPKGAGSLLKEALPFLPLAGFALESLNKPKIPYSGFLQGAAGSLAEQGAQLRGYLQGGTLPPGQEAALTSAADAANASIASEYASRGMTASSAEAQDQQAVQDRKVAASAQIAMQLFGQGVQETNASDQLYTQLMQAQLNQDAQLQSAFGNFATALAGMGRPVYANAA